MAMRYRTDEYVCGATGSRRGHEPVRGEHLGGVEHPDAEGAVHASGLARHVEPVGKHLSASN